MNKVNLADINASLQKLTDIALTFAPKLVGALILLITGMWVVNTLVKIMSKTMERTNISPEIQPFLSSLVNVLLKVLLIFSAAGIVGIETTSFVAMLGAAAFAVGIALQGSLSNFAAGIMILIFKPFKVGDLIKVNDQLGHVLEIQIFNTIIRTFDNKTVILPNSLAVGNVVTNLTTRDYLRVELSIQIPFEEDFDEIQKILVEALRNTPKVLAEPAPFVGINGFEDHGVKLDVFPFALVEDYWDVYYETYRNVKKALAQHKVKVPYPEGVAFGDFGKSQQ